jgi:Na+-driven multidrug efflux pump
MIRAGVIYIRAFSFDFLLIPFVFCINGFLIGGGHTMFTLIANLFSSILLRVPVCYFLGIVLNWGLLGVGLGAPAASFGTLIVMIIYLASGKWKQNAVFKEEPL